MSRRYPDTLKDESFRGLRGTLFWGPLRVPYKGIYKGSIKGLGFRVSENWGYLCQQPIPGLGIWPSILLRSMAPVGTGEKKAPSEDVKKSKTPTSARIASTASQTQCS